MSSQENNRRRQPACPEPLEDLLADVIDATEDVLRNRITDDDVDRALAWVTDSTADVDLGWVDELADIATLNGVERQVVAWELEAARHDARRDAAEVRRQAAADAQDIIERAERERDQALDEAAAILRLAREQAARTEREATTALRDARTRIRAERTLAARHAERLDRDGRHRAVTVERVAYERAAQIEKETHDRIATIEANAHERATCIETRALRRAADTRARADDVARAVAEQVALILDQANLLMQGLAKVRRERPLRWRPGAAPAGTREQVREVLTELEQHTLALIAAARLAEGNGAADADAEPPGSEGGRRGPQPAELLKACDQFGEWANAGRLPSALDPAAQLIPPAHLHAVLEHLEAQLLQLR